MTIIGSDMAIIGQGQHRLGRLQIRGLGKFLNIIIWKDDPKTLCPVPDPYFRHDLKGLSALENL